MCDYEFDSKFCNPKKHKCCSDFAENPNSITDSSKCSLNFIGKNCEESGIKCKQCNTSYKDFQSAVNHTCMPYKCKLCDTSFLFDYKLKMHKCAKKKMDDIEADESCAFVSSTSCPGSESLPHNEVICTAKKSKKCQLCGKKLSPRCLGLLCGNCKNKIPKGSKYSLRCKNLHKCVSSSSLSELSSNDGLISSSETQDPFECNHFKKILHEYDDCTTSSGVSDEHAPLPVNPSSKRMQLTISEKNSKKNNSSKRKIKISKLGQQPKCSGTSDVDAISSSVKRRKVVKADGRISKENISRESGDVYNLVSESSNDTALNDQIVESANLAVNYQDKLDRESRYCERYKKLKISMSSSSLSGNSLGSTSELLSISENMHAEIDDITMSSGISNDHDTENLPAESVEVNVTNKSKECNEVENESSKTETYNRECVTSDDIVNSRGPETSVVTIEKTKSIVCKSSRKNNSKCLEKELSNIETESYNSAVSKDFSTDFVAEPKTISTKKKDLSVDFKQTKKINAKEFVDVSSKADAEFTNHLLTKVSLVSKRKKDTSLKKPRSALNGFKHLSPERKTVTIDNSSKHLACDYSQTLPQENSKSNVLIASLEGTEKATRKKFSSNTGYFKGRNSDAKGNAVKFRHKKFSRNHNSSSEASVTMSSTVGNHKQHSFEKRKTFMIPENKKSDNNVSNSVSLGDLLKALPDHGVVLIKGFINTCCTFKCPKCNYIFKHIKKATDHTKMCPYPRYKEKELISLDDVEFICASCYQHWSSANEIYAHKKCRPVVSNSGGKPVSSSSISDIIYNYENANKNHVCPKCTYSCLSFHTFNQHQCEKRLELMKTCVVAVEKLTKQDLVTFDNLSKFECPSCQDVFFDNATFQNHSKIHVNVGLNAAKSHVHSGKAYAKKEIKKILSSNSDCSSVDEIKKRVLEPISEIFSCLDSANFFPDLDLDVSMSHEQQKLFNEAAKQVLSENIGDFSNLTKSFKGLTPSDSDEDVLKDSDSKDSITVSPEEPSVSSASTSFNDFHCKCIKETDPKVEEKPCLKCLNEYMRRKMNEGSETPENNTAVQTNSTATACCSSAAVASSSDSGAAVLTIDSVTTVDNSSGISNESHSTFFAAPEDFPHLTEEQLNIRTHSSVSSSHVANVASVTDTSDSCHTASNADISTKDSATPSVLANTGECSCPNPLQSNGTKILCYVPNASASTVNEETSGPKVFKKTLLNHYRPIDIDAEKALLVLQEIRLHSKSEKLILYVGIESKNCSESVEKGKKIAFLEMLLDISHLVIFTSPLNLSADCETHDCAHVKNSNYKNLEDPSADFLEHVQTPGFDEVQFLQSLPGPKYIYYWEFDELMSFLLGHENDFGVSFEVQTPFSVKIMVDWFFDTKTEYSVYVIKSSGQYACGICLEELCVSSILEHLTAVHKETLINVLIT